jgi:hypothetical protein
MLTKLRRHLTYANVVSTLCLFILLGGSAFAAVRLSKNSVRSKHIKNEQVRSVDVKNASLLSQDFAPGQLPRGDKGDRGPSFGDGKQLPNVANIPCQQDSVVGSQALTVAEPSRIWVHGHGTLSDQGSDATEYGLHLRLRDAANTVTMAVSAAAFDAEAGGSDTVFPLSTGGVLLTGADPITTPGGAFVAPPGDYNLQLVASVRGGSGCTDPLPDFGYNLGGGMGYVLLGTG